MSAWDPILDLLARGYAVVCIGTDERLLRAVAERAAASGLVLWCHPRVRVPAEVLPANSAVVRCDAAFLPILSHALDAALLELDRVDDATLAEVRRTLARGGVAAVQPVENDGQDPAEIRRSLAALGFALQDESTAKLLLATAP